VKVIKYRDDFLSLFRLLRDKTFSKRGFSWSGKLLSSALLTLTHTYPLENKFVNPEEWASEGDHYYSARDNENPDCSADFRNNHHRFWGKLYKPEDIKVGLIICVWARFSSLG
jgi:proteasome activator subunit 4